MGLSFRLKRPPSSVYLIFIFKEFTILYTNEKGQGLVEYALIILVVALAVIVALNFLGPRIGNVFSEIGDTLTTV